MTDSYSLPRKLQPLDPTEDFDSGQADLNEWLHRYALVSQRSGMATVFVTRLADRIAGYYAISTAGVMPEVAPPRVTAGVPKHPIPTILLARLAVDLRDQGKGVGKALVADALRRVAAIADEVGVRALLLHAKDERTRAFYLSIAEFEPSPTDDLHLFLLMKDLRKAISG